MFLKISHCTRPLLSAANRTFFLMIVVAADIDDDVVEAVMVVLPVSLDRLLFVRWKFSSLIVFLPGVTDLTGLMGWWSLLDFPVSTLSLVTNCCFKSNCTAFGIVAWRCSCSGSVGVSIVPEVALRWPLGDSSTDFSSQCSSVGSWLLKEVHDVWLLISTEFMVAVVEMCVALRFLYSTTAPTLPLREWICCNCMINYSLFDYGIFVVQRRCSNHWTNYWTQHKDGEMVVGIESDLVGCEIVDSTVESVKKPAYDQWSWECDLSLGPMRSKWPMSLNMPLLSEPPSKWKGYIIRQFVDSNLCVTPTGTGLVSFFRSSSIHEMNERPTSSGQTFGVVIVIVGPSSCCCWSYISCLSCILHAWK